jgi:hypothetical protein
MSFIAYYLTLLLVTSYAIASKARFERLLGGLLILNSLAATTLQRLLHDFYPLLAILVIDVGLLSAVAWILWRYRRPWIVIICTVQALVVGFDCAQVVFNLLPANSYADLMTMFAYTQLATLGVGVLWRTYGPPAEPQDSMPQPRGPVH